MNAIPDYQRRLFPYAYNILGSVDDALDAVQDVVTHYLTLPKKELDNERGYLIRSVVNRAINMKKRSSRTTDAAWLPEPVATETADGEVRTNEIISYSLLVLLEHLNAKERAVFILKEAFDYPHEEIGAILDISVDNSRKLLNRARNELKNARKDRAPDSSVPPDFLNDYIRIIKNGDTKALEKKLAEEVSFRADGGGKIRIVRELTTGTAAVQELITYLHENYRVKYDVYVREINHQPALLYYNDGLLVNCQVFELTMNRSAVQTIYSIVDPAKLKNISPF
jgi:RNA polymerase sigma factor (sigma-70 family)